MEIGQIRLALGISGKNANVLSERMLKHIAKAGSYLQESGEVLETKIMKDGLLIISNPANIRISVNFKEVTKLRICFDPDEAGQWEQYRLWNGEHVRWIHSALDYEELKISESELDGFDFESQLEKLLQISAKFYGSWRMLESVIEKFEIKIDALYRETSAEIRSVLSRS